MAVRTARAENMDIDREQLSPLETTLLELQQAERAGVFRATRVESRMPVAVDPIARAARVRRVAIRLGVVAAVLLIAATVWTAMFRSELANLRQQRDAFAAASAQLEAGTMSFADCMSGPSTTEILDACREHDANGDGFIDLRDFSTVQLASARIIP